MPYCLVSRNLERWLRVVLCPLPTINLKNVLILNFYNVFTLSMPSSLPFYLVFLEVGMCDSISLLSELPIYHTKIDLTVNHNLLLSTYYVPRTVQEYGYK